METTYLALSNSTLIVKLRYVSLVTNPNDVRYRLFPRRPAAEARREGFLETPSAVAVSRRVLRKFGAPGLSLEVQTGIFWPVFPKVTLIQENCFSFSRISEVSFTCDPGYSAFDGDDHIICTNAGTWPPGNSSIRFGFRRTWRLLESPCDSWKSHPSKGGRWRNAGDSGPGRSCANRRLRLKHGTQDLAKPFRCCRSLREVRVRVACDQLVVNLW